MHSGRRQRLGPHRIAVCDVGGPAQSSRSGDLSLRYAKNLSFPSQCAEEDNVNIPIYGGYVSDYQVTATFPTYYPLTIGQQDLCLSDMTNCERAWDMRPTAQIAYYDAAERTLKFAWQSPGYYWYPIETLIGSMRMSASMCRSRIRRQPDIGWA